MSASRSTENSARAASAPITRARTGRTIAPPLICIASSSAVSTRSAPLRLAGASSKRIVICVPCPAAPEISKLSERAAIRGRPSPSESSSPTLVLG